MERLTEYLGGIPHIKRTINGINSKANYLRDFDIEAVKKLAAYEDLEEQDRLIVLPCKVGATCKHAVGGIYLNPIGEACLFCEIWNEQRNITLGECLGNCESAEAEKAMEVRG